MIVMTLYTNCRIIPTAYVHTSDSRFALARSRLLGDESRPGEPENRGSTAFMFDSTTWNARRPTHRTFLSLIPLFVFSMQSSGYSLHAPAEPEPRNVITVPATEHAVLSGGDATRASAAIPNTTGTSPEVLENSASPADVSHEDRSAEMGAAGQEETSGSGWQWADRAQVCRYSANVGC